MPPTTSYSAEDCVGLGQMGPGGRERQSSRKKPWRAKLKPRSRVFLAKTCFRCQVSCQGATSSPGFPGEAWVSPMLETRVYAQQVQLREVQAGIWRPGVGEEPELFGPFLGRIWARPPTQQDWQGHLFSGLWLPRGARAMVTSML